MLTTGLDNFVGTAGNDTFLARTINGSNTFQDGDMLDGGAGSDVVYLDFASLNTNATTPKQAGLPEVRMHDLRHSMASNMVNSGRSIYEVAKVLGHTQLKTSQRYSHLSQETLLAAVDASANATGTDWGPAEKAKAGENSGVGWR